MSFLYSVCFWSYIGRLDAHVTQFRHSYWQQLHVILPEPCSKCQQVYSLSQTLVSEIFSESWNLQSETILPLTHHSSAYL